MELYVHLAGKEDAELVDLPEKTVLRELLVSAEADGSEELLWLEDADDPLEPSITLEAAGLKHRDHVHRGRCRRVDVKVRFNAVVKSREFSPASTASRVLKWATGKQGFDLTAAEAAKHALATPGADHALDPRVHIGSLVATGSCEILLDLVPKARFEG